MYPEYKYTPSQPKNMSEIISHKIRQAAATNSDINLRHATAIHNSANIGNNNTSIRHLNQKRVKRNENTIVKNVSEIISHIKLDRLRPQTATQTGYYFLTRFSIHGNERCAGRRTRSNAKKRTVVCRCLLQYIDEWVSRVD